MLIPASRDRQNHVHGDDGGGFRQESGWFRGQEHGGTCDVSSLLDALSATVLLFPCQAHSLAGLGVSYKRQHYAPRLRKFPGTVQELFEKTIQNASQRFSEALGLNS